MSLVTALLLLTAAGSPLLADSPSSQCRTSGLHRGTRPAGAWGQSPLYVAPQALDTFLATLSALAPDAPVDKLAALVDPSDGLTVDIAAEGSKKPSWVTVNKGSDPKDVDKALRPVVASGAFKATPYCKAEGKTHTCTFMTTTSVPRVCTIMTRDAGLFISKIAWQAQPADPSDDDDDLPM
jgi:hypothetical protein